ncbi:MAG: hypothetical protein GX116_08505 [Fibrobacter sp.]|jgi:hypothetical protein|nr:hypothetical protein [Fibrobacter sp.]
MKKLIFILSLVFFANVFANENDSFSKTNNKNNAPIVGIGFNLFSGSSEWRATYRLDQSLAIFLLSNFARNSYDNSTDASYNFSLGLGASFSLAVNPLPLYVGATAKYIHPATNQNGVAFNVFGGAKAIFLNAFEVAGELGVYARSVSNSNEISLRPAIYLSWFFI